MVVFFNFRHTVRYDFISVVMTQVEITTGKRFNCKWCCLKCFWEKMRDPPFYFIWASGKVIELKNSINFVPAKKFYQFCPLLPLSKKMKTENFNDLNKFLCVGQKLKYLFINSFGHVRYCFCKFNMLIQ